MPYNATAVEVRKLARDTAGEVPRTISSGQKIGHALGRVGRFVGRNVGRYFRQKCSGAYLGKFLGDGAGEALRFEILVRFFVVMTMT
jgi:hypothetical protein